MEKFNRIDTNRIDSQSIISAQKKYRPALSIINNSIIPPHLKKNNSILFATKKIVSTRNRVAPLVSFSIILLILLPIVSSDETLEGPKFPDSLSYIEGKTTSGNLYSSLRNVDNNKLTMEDSDKPLVEESIFPVYANKTVFNGAWEARRENPDEGDDCPPEDEIWVHLCFDDTSVSSDNNESYARTYANTSGKIEFPKLDDIIPSYSIISIRFIVRVLIGDNDVTDDPNFGIFFRFLENNTAGCIFFTVNNGDIDYSIYKSFTTSFYTTCAGNPWTNYGNTKLQMEFMSSGMANPNTNWGHYARITQIFLHIKYMLNRNALDMTFNFTIPEKYTMIRLDWNCNYNAFSEYYIGIKSLITTRWLNTTSSTNQTHYSNNCPFAGNFYANISSSERINNYIYIRVVDNQTEYLSYLKGSISFDYIAIIISESSFVSRESLQWLLYAAIIGGTLFGVSFIFYLWKKRRDGN